MSSSETEVSTKGEPTAVVANVRTKKSESLVDKVLGVLSSVRFGIIMLSIVLICCMIGMFIMQVEVEDFPQYYAKLTPAQRTIYGKLDLFNIYHSKLFTLLLAITALNIILASIDRFPTAWQYVVKPKLKASPNFIRAQTFNHEANLKGDDQSLVPQIISTWRNQKEITSAVNVARLTAGFILGLLFISLYGLIEHSATFWILFIPCVAASVLFLVKGLRFDVRVSEENGRKTIFGQMNSWNRLGAYIVHVALMFIFVGGFLTSQYGVSGMMEITPGETGNKFFTQQMNVDGPASGQATLPFNVECTDLQQKLIRPEGGLEATNTIDWLSYVKIKDGNFEKDALVHLNNPYDYKGYRLFQSKFTAFGFARSIVVRFEPTNGGEAREVTIPRNGSADVEGIGRVTYADFFPDFQIGEQGRPVSKSPDYHNPVAQLEIVLPDGKQRGALAFNPQMIETVLQETNNDKTGNHGENLLLVNGHKVILKEFEKAAMGHTLAVQYDPGRTPAYIGFFLLCAALCGVFFFAHQRIWAVIEPVEKGSKVYFGGNTNRNRQVFEGRFNSLVESVTGGGNHE
jgi:cytochrome c biogenesis protein